MTAATMRNRFFCSPMLSAAAGGLLSVYLSQLDVLTALIKILLVLVIYALELLKAKCLRIMVQPKNLRNQDED